MELSSDCRMGNYVFHWLRWLGVNHKTSRPSLGNAPSMRHVEDVSKFTICPHCGSHARLGEMEEVYGRNYGTRSPHLWICEKYPICNSYVGCHPGTKKPLGYLASQYERDLRKLAHSLFDPIWQKKEMTRGQAYERMAEILDIEKNDAHISQLSTTNLKKLIRSLELRKRNTTRVDPRK
jgi:hypothetical protein